MLDRKLNFRSKFAINTLPCYFWKFWHWKFKFLHTLFAMYLAHILAKFEPNCRVQNVPNLSFKTKKRVFKKKEKRKKNVFDKTSMPYCKTFLWLKQLYNGKLLIFRLPSVSVSKLCIKHSVRSLSWYFA